MKDKKEIFYKIGITTSDKTKKRFYGNKIPYKYEILTEIKCDLYTAVMWEDRIKKANKHKQYIPNKIFGGHTECFSTPINMPST